MKLRNKKTGELVDLAKRGLLKSDNDNHIIVYPEGTLKYYAYDSLAELNEDWEDYKPKEPLIKDEKIRKAVRAWAELCGIDRCHFEHNEGSFETKWYCMSLPTSKHGENIETGFYTIAELCGEEEE